MSPSRLFFFFDSLYVAAAEAFYFAAEFEVFPDFVVVEDAEAVYDRGGGTCRFHDVLGV